MESRRVLAGEKKGRLSSASMLTAVTHQLARPTSGNTATAIQGDGDPGHVGNDDLIA